VAVVGTGLTSMDVIAALTVGRGGRHDRGVDGRLVYTPSGHEPRLVLINRSGWLPCARPAADRTRAAADPHFMRPDALREAAAVSGTLDVRHDVEPLVHAEMVRVAGDAAPAVLRVLRPPASWTSADEYRAAVRRRAEADLVEARLGLRDSAYKRALEVLRDHREFLRTAVDLGLSPRAKADFFGRFAATVNRCVIGPQKERIEEVLALFDAGVATMAPGPDPAIVEDGDRWRLESRHLDRRETVPVDLVLGSTSTWPVRDAAHDPVATRLRLAEAPWFDSLPLSRDGFVLRDGAPLRSVAVLGPPCEGVSYYNHYVPSPGVPSRALRDIDRVLAVHLPALTHSELSA
jgi:hypothetical protein